MGPLLLTTYKSIDDILRFMFLLASFMFGFMFAMIEILGHDDVSETFSKSLEAFLFIFRATLGQLMLHNAE